VFFGKSNVLFDSSGYSSKLFRLGATDASVLDAFGRLASFTKEKLSNRSDLLCYCMSGLFSKGVSEGASLRNSSSTFAVSRSDFVSGTNGGFSSLL
jgi:hypothetical protein